MEVFIVIVHAFGRDFAQAAPYYTTQTQITKRGQGQESGVRSRGQGSGDGFWFEVPSVWLKVSGLGFHAGIMIREPLRVTILTQT